LTVDEELSKLEDSFRRLKIEYEAYFNGGKPRPPNDLLYGVEQAIKKISNDTSKLNYGQRFRFNQLVQRHAVHNELWRKKLRNKEEGRTALPRRHSQEEPAREAPTRVVCSDPDREQVQVDQLLQALIDAKRRTGEQTEGLDPARFRKFLSDKTSHLQQTLGCKKVQFSVTVENGRVKFTAVKGD
jgi:hypothetical protein